MLKKPLEIKFKVTRTNYSLTQHKMVMPGAGRYQEAREEVVINKKQNKNEAIECTSIHIKWE
jgi:hypothetical protein